MKLQTKLLIFLIFLLLFLGGLIVFLSKQVVHSVLISEVAKRGTLKTAGSNEEMAPDFRSGDEGKLLSLLQVLLDRTGAVYAIALDPTGRVLAHTNVIEKGKIYHDPATSDALRLNTMGYRMTLWSGQWLVDVSLPVWSVHKAESSEEFVLYGGKELKETTRLGTLRLGFSAREALESEGKIFHQVLMIMVVSGLLALGASGMLMKKLLLGVRLLREGTERIAKGQYGTEVQMVSRDELGDLARGFNQMSKELESAHTNLENEVTARTQELESVIYTMSHDLKSPVVSMQGMASLLLKKSGDRLDEKGKHYAERIIANAHFMEELISGLLSISRIGRKQQNSELADLKQVLQQILDIHKERFTEKKIKLVIDPALPDFSFEKVQLTQIFQNLISNAAKFMGEEADPRIEVGGRELDEWVEFYVKDNGIGIDPAYHDKVFGIFQRLREVEVEGTGVGLSIVKKIVDLAGGKIWIDSKKGKGATFFIRFPKSQRVSKRPPY